MIIINMCLCIGINKYKKKIVIEIKQELIAEDLNIPLSILDRLSRQRINKETVYFNNTGTKWI